MRALGLLAIVACGSEPITSDPAIDAGADVAAVATDSGTAADAQVQPEPTLAALVRAKTAACAQQISTGKYALDQGSADVVPVCQLQDAVFFTADMDIDCDGKVSAKCSKTTDPSFLPSTAGTDSKGQPLDAATLPYVVVPLAGTRFDYRKHGIAMGSTVAVLYKDTIAYGVVGDAGPSAIIGEASYAMAERLAINPNPKSGGTDSGVTYIIFTSAGSAVKKLEDNAEATTVGTAKLHALLGIP